MGILSQQLRLPSDSSLGFCLLLLAAFKRDVIAQPRFRGPAESKRVCFLPSRSSLFPRVGESACARTHTHRPRSCATCSLWEDDRGPNTCCERRRQLLTSVYFTQRVHKFLTFCKRRSQGTTKWACLQSEAFCCQVFKRRRVGKKPIDYSLIYYCSMPTASLLAVSVFLQSVTEKVHIWTRTQQLPDEGEGCGGVLKP